MDGYTATLEMARSVSEHLMNELAKNTADHIAIQRDMGMNALVLINAMISHLEAGQRVVN